MIISDFNGFIQERTKTVLVTSDIYGLSMRNHRLGFDYLFNGTGIYNNKTMDRLLTFPSGMQLVYNFKYGKIIKQIS